MNKNPRDIAAITEALRLLGNPYAKLQIFDEVEDVTLVADFRPLTDAEHAYVRRLENPYASLSVAIEVEESVQEKRVAAVVVSASDAPNTSISKHDFEAGCRRIFRQYIPALEKGRLRPHHRAFITRNHSRSPSLRYCLLEQLRKYDLSSIRGLQVQFNREREELTADKLTQIERAVIGEEI